MKPMPFQKFREILRVQQDQKALIQWTNSGVVEVAELLPNNTIKILNVVSGRAYLLRRTMTKLNLKFYKEEFVALGDLVPKYLRNNNG